MSRDDTRPRNRWAALVLAVLAPVVAELTFGSTPLRMAYLVLLWLPIYGAGVLLIREVARRAGGGWPTLLLLGVAYELAEDGLGLQALTSPHLYANGHWGRLFGINFPYWEANAIYHVVFSVLIPIALTELLFPAHGRRPYLRTGGVVGVGICAVAGVGLVRISVPPYQDPGYDAPPAALLGFLLGIVVLAVLALAVLPRFTRKAAPPAVPAPRPVPLGLFGLVAALVTMASLTRVDAERTWPVFHGPLVAVPMAIGAVTALGTIALVRRWVLDATGTLWLIGGALVAHSLWGAVVFGSTVPDEIGLIVFAALTAPALVLVHRRAVRT